MTCGVRLLLLLFTAFGVARASSPNWTGPYTPCNRHADLFSREHMDVGLKVSTSNLALARQFERAMDFWAGVLDLAWHETDSGDCAIQLLDGAPRLFDFAGPCSCVIARSQFPDRPGFEGWIAFNPALHFTTGEMFRNSVHEIGHLLGLHHNPDSSSVMFFSDFDQKVSLDAADLDALASLHKLRAGIRDRTLKTAYVAVSPDLHD